MILQKKVWEVKLKFKQNYKHHPNDINYNQPPLGVKAANKKGFPLYGNDEKEFKSTPKKYTQENKKALTFL